MGGPSCRFMRLLILDGPVDVVRITDTVPYRKCTLSKKIDGGFSDPGSLICVAEILLGDVLPCRFPCSAPIPPRLSPSPSPSPLTARRGRPLTVAFCPSYNTPLPSFLSHPRISVAGWIDRPLLFYSVPFRSAHAGGGPLHLRLSY